jgi:hypothetical protein
VAELGRAAALVLAAVFAVAGAAKALRPGPTAQTFTALRLPAPELLSAAVPAAELVLALLLVLRSPFGGLVALALLALFSAVLARQLRQGATLACGCFGSAGREPISVAHLVRNMLLAVLALAALAAPDQPVMPSLPAVIAATTAAVTGLVAVALVRVRLVTGRLLAVELEAGR